MRKVITYGTFDVLHWGHIRLLKRARDLGDFLIVGVSTDEFNERNGKKARLPYETRKKTVELLRCVDLVVPETEWGQKRKDIVEHGCSVLAMGDDWKGKFDDLSDIAEVVYLPRTPGISSSEIRKRLEGDDQDKTNSGAKA